MPTDRQIIDHWDRMRRLEHCVGPRDPKWLGKAKRLYRWLEHGPLPKILFAVLAVGSWALGSLLVAANTQLAETRIQAASAHARATALQHQLDHCGPPIEVKGLTRPQRLCAVVAEKRP